MMNLLKTIIFLILCFGCLNTAIQAQTTEFTYQGNLKNGANPATGNYDFEFLLFDDLVVGTQSGSTLTRSSVAVVNGIFSVKLDFGGSPFSPFTNRFLEIHVRQTGGGGFTTLTPRQSVTTTPYSITSLNALNSLNATNAAQLGGLSLSGFIQNTTSPQASSNFNITGFGTANFFNSATGYYIGGSRILNSPGADNIFAGRLAGVSNNSGSVNSFFGYRAGEANLGGSSNSFFGERSGLNSQFINNSFFGAVAGQTNISGGNNTIIGTLADVGSPNLNFATALGAGAVVTTSNTVTLGRSVDTVQIPGLLTVTGGIQSTSGGFTFPDGSVQTTAVSSTFTNPQTSSVAIPINGTLTAILHLNLPAGTYMITATVQFRNNANFLGQNNNRVWFCRMFQDANFDQAYVMSVAGADTGGNILTTTLHSVVPLSAAGSVELRCHGATGGADQNSVVAEQRRLTAVKIGGNAVVQ